MPQGGKPALHSVYAVSSGGIKNFRRVLGRDKREIVGDRGENRLWRLEMMVVVGRGRYSWWW